MQSKHTCRKKMTQNSESHGIQPKKVYIVFWICSKKCFMNRYVENRKAHRVRKNYEKVEKNTPIGFSGNVESSVHTTADKNLVYIRQIFARRPKELYTLYFFYLKIPFWWSKMPCWTLWLQFTQTGRKVFAQHRKVYEFTKFLRNRFQKGFSLHMACSFDNPADQWLLRVWNSVQFVNSKIFQNPALGR